MTAHPARTLSGDIAVPGDKSISHRALMFAGLAIGRTTIRGLLEGEDVLRTAAAMRALGAGVQQQADGLWVIDGVGIGGLREPEDVLDMGNSGTAARLLAGILASHPIFSVMTGDPSLRRRPMARVIAPLQETGARFAAREGGRLPLAIQGAADCLPLEHRMVVASAQVKSAILLAGLNARGVTRVEEPIPTRDHSENMLRHFGADVTVEPDGSGRVITLVGQPMLLAADVTVPGDPSSAAFPLVAALLAPGSRVVVRGVGLNPLRTGLFSVLRRMGGSLAVSAGRIEGGEPVGDVTAEGSALAAVDVAPEHAPSMIDEYPILAVACACARGTSRLRGLAELRVKESDRLTATADLLIACGVGAEVEGDDLIVHGAGGPPTGGGNVATRMDHRLAMSALVLGGGGACAGRDRRRQRHRHQFSRLLRAHEHSRLRVVVTNAPLVIAIDGPAAAGKGTLARRLAASLELPYLDTGKLYRATGRKVLDGMGDPADPQTAEAAAACLKAADLNRDDLRTPEVDRAAACVASIPGVRAALLAFQREFGRVSGAVLDGRDIGTVIFPDARAKLYVTASVDARARRRWLELRARGLDAAYEMVRDDMQARDAADAAREAAPLRPADDALMLDTTALDADEAFVKALALLAGAGIA